jgi:F0F1-type ATP synthase assembly protein I
MEENKKQKKSPVFSALGLAFELGYLIAIPLVLLAVGGRLLDKKLNSSPFLFLTGIIFSILISSFLVYKKTKEVIDEINE